MIPLTHHRDDTMLVVGYGKSGQSAARALAESGAHVQVWDDDAAKRTQAQSDGYTAVDLESVDLSKFDAVIWSPGVPHTHPAPHPLAEKARAAGHDLRCDVDLLATAQPQATFIGITGTNGKSTTTALIGHIFKTAGKMATVGGNLGLPVLDLEPLDEDGIYVLELSSYQIELTPNLSCATAVLLNITPDHLDRHGGFEGYVTAKATLFTRQQQGATAIVGIDDSSAMSVYDSLADTQNRIPISSTTRADRGVYAEAGKLFDALDGDPISVADLTSAKALPGQHNWQNAAAGYAVARRHGVDGDAIASAIETFPGLPHRQEFVGASSDVTYINDSKATNANAAEKALSCYRHIYWIAGGQAKEGGIATLTPLFDRIQHAFLIGEAAEDFASLLNQNGVSVSVHDSLEDAIAEAGTKAKADGLADATVLLSPACASFDMFESFEQRGDTFRNTVRNLWPETAHVSAEEQA